MKIKVQWQNSGHPTEYDMPEESLREGIDYAIRNNPDFWEVLRDVAGKYQAELLRAEARRRGLFKKQS